jgi:hypothetical protein
MAAPTPRFRKGQQEELADLKVRVRSLRLWVSVVAAVAALGMVTGSAANIAACESRHAIVTVGTQVIAGPQARARLREYLESGVITRAQYRVAVADLEKRLAVWKSADCRLPWPVRIVF